MDGALRDLGRQLLRCADRELLDAPLDVSCNTIADSEARELLLGLFEAGTADRLRELLEADRLAAWASECCTAREEAALCAQLGRWLGGAQGGPDDPERLVELPPVPRERVALQAWAARHGVTQLLEQPLTELLDDRDVGDATLLDGCLGKVRRARGRSLLASDDLTEEARSLLAARAARATAEEARRALHEAPLAAGALGVLARRLRALFMHERWSEVAALRFVPARPVRLEPGSGVCRAFVRAEAATSPIELALHLSGYEQRALEGSCSECGAQGCAHLAALAARLFEACQHASDRLHPQLVALVAVPSWQRFLAALAPERTTDGEGARIVFDLRREGERLTVGALLRRPAANGRSTPGKLASPQTLARSVHARDRDSVVLEALSARARTLAPQYLSADLSVLRGLVEHPSVELEGTSCALRVSEESAEVTFAEQPEGLVPRVLLAGKPLVHSEAQASARYAFTIDRERSTLVFCALSPPLLRLLAALASFRGVLPPESYGAVAPALSPLGSSARIHLPRALEGRSVPPPERLLLRVTPRFDEGIDVSLTCRALPLAPLWSPGQGPELVHGQLDGVHTSVRRDLPRERETAQRVIEALALADRTSLGPFAYRIDSTQEALALLAAAARAQDLVAIEWAERARPLRVSGTVQRAALKVELFKQGEWCALRGGVALGDRFVPIDRLLEAARQGERFVPIEGGDYAEIEQSLLDRLERAQLCTMPSARELGLSSAALPHWREQLGEQSEGGDEESRTWLQAAREAARAEVQLPALALALRDYQREGAAWLIERSRWAPGACLADEMGLGKTAQTIAVLAARAELGPALVIAPTSVVDNWLRELQRFAPGLRPLRYRGAKRRALLADVGNGAVVVASYDLVLRDRPHFAALSLATLVVDEAQSLKNARTRRARAAATLRASFRIALTGTPVENRLADLWSLFQLIAPGLLGSWSLFRARFAVPIERYENAERAAALRALVSPLLLRRTKVEVARELPPRTDVVHAIELSPAERDLYAAAVAHARRAFGKRRRHPDDSTRTVQILAELTRLRQLACHPRLVLGDSRVTSSKLRAFLRLVDDVIPRGHRMLVFSQFVRHLELVREALTARGYGSLYLDGSTEVPERARRIDAFQRGEAPLFLISLKAGGTGLNLTRADYVVHLDPWWNPAAEDQASDRAHRIGQDRPVTVVRLVAQGTIEERVLQLHEHKRLLAASVLQSARSANAGALDAATLESLLLE